MSQLPYDTFREMLANKYPNCGHALWEPSPGGLYDSVEVGDVGFIRQGCFHRLFNVLLPGNHPSHQNFGVPEHHQPLRLNAPNHIHRGIEGTDDFCSRHVNLSRGRDIHALGPDDDYQVTVSCPGRRGAMLSLPFPAQREDTVALGDFGRWIVKHIDVWFAYAENLGLGINRMQDIVLVTGRHCAKSWVNVAFSEGERDAEVSFGAQPSGVSGVNIERRLVRGDVVLKLGPSGENLPENQCIFIRGYRVVRIMKIWPRLRGRAGPAPDVGGHEPEPEPNKQLEVIGASTNANDQDPLHVLLQYIAERAPDCDMVLVHDDDVARIDGVPIDSHKPDVLMEHLRNSAPEIRQVQWGNESRPGAEVAVTKIATLAEGAFTIEQSMAVTNESPMRIGDIQVPSQPNSAVTCGPTNTSELPTHPSDAGDEKESCFDVDYESFIYPDARMPLDRSCSANNNNSWFDSLWESLEHEDLDESREPLLRVGDEDLSPSAPPMSSADDLGHPVFNNTPISMSYPIVYPSYYPPTASDVPGHSMADTTKDYAPNAASFGSSAGLYDVEEEEHLGGTPEDVPITQRDWTPAGGKVGGNTDDPWSGYDAPGWNASTNINVEGREEWICPEHGEMCILWICKARAGLGSNRRRETEHKERINAKKKEKRKEGEKRERKLVRAVGREVPLHDPLPYAADYPYRRVGGGSTSKDDSPQDSSAYGENEWIDEDVGIESVTVDSSSILTSLITNPEI